MECTIDQSTVYLSAPKVIRRFGISKQTLWRWLHDQAFGFPQPFYIHRNRYFSLCELIAWEHSRRRGNITQRAA
jgi:predicted DNA-binding transcriptional regulator AlpA